MKIGIGISTTPNRKVLNLDTWNKYLPKGAKLVVHYDVHYMGVARSKNNLLAELVDCDHIFLVDDDVVPLKKGWHLPYINHPEPHLMYQFKLPGKPATDMQELYRGEQTIAYSHTRGAFIYVDRHVLDVVGGFDTAYGQYGFEHPDFTNRIHNAGLTTHRAMDVPNSHELLYCLDQDGKAESSLSGKVRHASMIKNHQYYKSQRNSKDYKDFK